MLAAEVGPDVQRGKGSHQAGTPQLPGCHSLGLRLIARPGEDQPRGLGDGADALGSCEVDATWHGRDRPRELRHELYLFARIRVVDDPLCFAALKPRGWQKIDSVAEVPGHLTMVSPVDLGQLGLGFRIAPVQDSESAPLA